MSVKIIRWLVFSVAIALLPLVANLLKTNTEITPWELSTIIGRGELLLIVAALCATAIGDLVGSTDHLQGWKIVSGGACIVLLLLATIYYEHVSSLPLIIVEEIELEAIRLEAIVSTSLWLFGFTVFSTVVSVGLGEV